MFSELPNFYVTAKLAKVLCNLLCTLEWGDRERKDSISAKISSCLSSTFLHSSQGHHRTLHNCLMQGLLFSDLSVGAEVPLSHCSPTVPRKKNLPFWYCRHQRWRETHTAESSKSQGEPPATSDLASSVRCRAWLRTTVLESLWQ